MKKNVYDKFFPPATIVIYGLLIKMNVCLLGVVMAACRLTVLYRFNVMKTPTEQIRNLINYKRCYFFESVVGAPLCVLGICATLYFEHTTSPFINP